MLSSLESRARSFRWTRWVAGLALFALVIALTTMMGGSEPESEAVESSSLAEAPSPAELLTVMMVVITLLGATLWFLPKLLRRGRLAPGKERVLTLVDALPLGPRRQVYVVRFGDRTLILGGGHEDVSLIAEYSSDELHSETADTQDTAPVRPAVESIEESDGAPQIRSPRTDASPSSSGQGSATHQRSGVPGGQPRAARTRSAQLPAAFDRVVRDSMAAAEDPR